MKLNYLLLIFGLVLMIGQSGLTSAADSVVVHPKYETAPIGFMGDADDVCIWVHPDDPNKSLVVGTDKDYGLRVYDLQGNEIQSLPDGEMNNVDIRYNFPLIKQDDQTIRRNIMIATNRTTNSLDVYSIDPKTQQIELVTARTIVIQQGEVYGCCLNYNWKTDQFYAFVNTKEGHVLQFELFNDGNNQVDAYLVQEFKLASQPEGCVADDFTQQLYIGEEQRGIWKLSTNPNKEPQPELIASTKGTGRLTADVEGLTIYHAAYGEGYLIASSQGSDEYVIYDRQPPHDYIGTFKIERHKTIDGTQSTDGIDVIATPLGDVFPNGLFVAQDGSNSPGISTNFKYVSWSHIATSFSPNLMIDTSWNPRINEAETE